MNYILDAKNKRLGRLASEIAQILQDKRQVSYDPSKPGSDRVIVKNAAQIQVTGNKVVAKTYYRHTGYMGHLRAATLKEMLAKYPQRVLEWAVYNMLPKNRLRQQRMNRLTIET